jgi:hypothetical protein
VKLADRVPVALVVAMTTAPVSASLDAAEAGSMTPPSGLASAIATLVLAGRPLQTTAIAEPGATPVTIEAFPL